MHLAGESEPDVAVDTGSRIPARVGLLRVVDADGEHVGLGAIAHIGRQFVAEGAVAVGPQAERAAVDPYFAVAVDPVKIDEYGLAGIGRRQSELFAVPADAAGEGAPAGRGRMLAAERAFNAPVVRQIEHAPLHIVKAGLLRSGQVPEVEFPAPGEAFDPARLLNRRRAAAGQAGYSQQRESQDGNGLAPSFHGSPEGYFMVSVTASPE